MIMENPTFPGEKDGLLAYDGSLRLAPALQFDEFGDIDTVSDFNTGGLATIESEGTYSFESAADVGAVRRLRLTTKLDATSFLVVSEIDKRVENIDTWEDWDGPLQGVGDAQVWYRQTDDDPDGANPAWSGWDRLDSAEAEARGFEFEVRLTSTDPAYNILVSTLEINIEELS